MLPGLRSQPAGSVIVSAASLLVRSGQVDLTLTVNVQPRQDASIGVQMPRFGWLGEAEAYPDRQFPELKILVDDVAAPMESSVAAFVGSVDVTPQVSAAGVDPFAVANTPPFVNSSAARPATLDALERLGAIEKYQRGYLAKWTVSRSVKARLTAGVHTVSVRYKSRPSFGLLRGAQISRPTYLTKYCLTANDLTRVLGKVDGTTTFAVTEEDVVVSVDGRRPGRVSVTVDPPTDRSALKAFCGVDGRSVLAHAADVQSSARPDPMGTVRILSVRRLIQSK
jgi:hypothetical protein